MNDESVTPEELLELAAFSFNLDGGLDDPSEDIYLPSDGKPVDLG